MHIWKSIRPHLSDLVRFFHISYIEATSQHRGTYLGVLWIPLSSLIFSAMLALVFRHSHVMPLGDFFLYVLTGYIFWGFIAASITGSTDVIQSRFEFAVHNNLSLPGLFGKLLIDRLFHYFLNLALLVALILLMSPSKIGPEIALFLPFLLLIAATSMGTAYLVNLVTIFYPDAKTLFSVGVRFMFFVSPVFWSVAETTSKTRAVLVQYNPVAYYLSLPRQVFGIEPIKPLAWFIAVIVSITVCIVACLAYHRSQGFVRNVK
ncbi:ABC transporter [Mesorhizobium sp. Root552]|uniref:ABC transporter permease n=1 Tax=Mesorhizobium sp. Root552 TaxID=1736555 RepID=UPI0006FBE45B|nr:ABC transporter permease [Mesorhizobium sp. Root552]KQZ28530.1 ABC transporter [Mesorhizobium sp. Root552]